VCREPSSWHDSQISHLTGNSHQDSRPSVRHFELLLLIQPDAENGVVQGLAQQALQSAQESYTPYTRCPAGMALVTGNSSVYRGGVIESCAYNPTINPLQAACITLAAKGKGAFSQVHELSCAVECYAFRSFP